MGGGSRLSGDADDQHGWSGLEQVKDASCA
jgi:hypothetical protein